MLTCVGGGQADESPRVLKSSLRRSESHVCSDQPRAPFCPRWVHTGGHRPNLGGNAPCSPAPGSAMECSHIAKCLSSKGSPFPQHTQASEWDTARGNAQRDGCATRPDRATGTPSLAQRRRQERQEVLTCITAVTHPPTAPVSTRSGPHCAPHQKPTYLTPQPQRLERQLSLEMGL